MRKGRSHPNRLNLFAALLGALLSHAPPMFLVLAGALALLLALSPLKSFLNAVPSFHTLGVRGYGLALVALGLHVSTSELNKSRPVGETLRPASANTAASQLGVGSTTLSLAR